MNLPVDGLPDEMLEDVAGGAPKRRTPDAVLRIEGLKTDLNGARLDKTGMPGGVVSGAPIDPENAAGRSNGWGGYGKK